MDCKQINEFLMDYLYQELDPAQVERFEAHLHECPGCTELVAGFEQTRSAFSELPEEEPPAAVSALLLREASRAAEPPAASFWEQLRAGIRAMVMHPAMTVATTMVLVLGVSFYVYKQGPTPGSSKMIDVPLVEESRTLDPDRTAAIGVSDREAPTAAQAPAAPAGENLVARGGLEKKEAAPAKLNAQAPAAREGTYDDLARLGSKGGTRGGGGAGANKSGRSLADNLEADSDSLDDMASNTINTVRRDTGKPTPRPASEPLPPPKPSVQLAKRNEKASPKGWGSAQGSAPADESTMGSAEQAAAAPKAKPAAPPPARRARAPRSPSKDKADDSLGSVDFWKGGGKALAGATEGEAAPAGPAEVQKEAKEEERQVQTKTPVTVAKKKARKQAPSPAPNQSQAADSAGLNKARALLEQGHRSADAGLCAKALEQYDRAVAEQSSLRSDRDLIARVNRCTGRLLTSGGESSVAQAQKRYPRLASLLSKELENQRVVARRKKAAESQKKAAKKSKAKKSADDKAATSY